MAASTAPKVEPVPTGQMIRRPSTSIFSENLRLLAEGELGLYADVAEQERKAGKRADTIRISEEAIHGGENKMTPFSISSHAGQPQQALMHADEDIDRAELANRNLEALKGKCRECAGRTGMGDENIAVARLEKAVALFATGNQQQGIAEVSEAQSSLSLARSEGFVETDKRVDWVAVSFVDLAAMYAIMGNGDGCLRALRELPDDENYGRHKKSGISLFSGCSWLVYAASMDSGASIAGMQTASSVRDQIDDIVRSGRYSTLPEPQIAARSTGSGPPSVSIKNDTRYNLTVLCSGPTERSIQVPPGQTSLVELTAGTYQVLGRVDAPNVLPMYKKYEFQSGPTYSFDFYISSR